MKCKLRYSMFGWALTLAAALSSPLLPAAPVPESERIPVDLRRTTLVVRDIDRSLPLYRDALGLNVIYDQVIGGTTRLVLLRANDDFIGVLGLMQRLNLETTPPAPVLQKAQPGQPILVFNVQDLDQRFEKIRAAAHVTVAEAPKLIEYPRADGGTIPVRFSAVWDADGNFIELNTLLGQAAGTTNAAQTFFDNLAALCGQKFNGEIIADRPPPAADDPFVGQALEMHVRDCSPNEIRVPFAVGADRSRTWIVTRTESGLRLKHDHRHEDGTPDSLTMYGGDTHTPGTAFRQSFPADAETIQLFRDEGRLVSLTNVWALELEPARYFVYELARPEGRLFRVRFDLTRPQNP